MTPEEEDLLAFDTIMTTIVWVTLKMSIRRVRLYRDRITLIERIQYSCRLRDAGKLAALPLTIPALLRLR